MKKFVLALAASAVLAGPAFAADMAARMPVKAAPAVAPVASWTGCYISGGGGYGLWQNSHDQVVTGAPNGGGVAYPVGQVVATDIDNGGRGWNADIGGGCDYQFGGPGFFGSMLIGAFADYTWSDVKGNYTTYAHYFADGSAVGNSGNLKNSSSWAVGGRIGWVVVPQLMTYINGGYTEADFDGVGFRNNIAGNGAGILGTVTGLVLPSTTYKGWFIGGGTEYAFATLPGLFLRSEYRYSTFDGQTNGLNCVGASAAGPAPSCLAAGPSGFADRTTIHSQTIKADLVWRFNFGGAGVVAKY
jgi:outer membrane immunogenic protein